jgi:hypothetical protein
MPGDFHQHEPSLRSNWLATDDDVKHAATSWLQTLSNDLFYSTIDALEPDVYHLLPMCHVYIEEINSSWQQSVCYHMI